MLSTRSSSPASPEPARSMSGELRRQWPTLVVLPALVSLLFTASISPLIVMFFGPHFGLSGGREAPVPWLITLIGLFGFWAAKLLERASISQNGQSAVLVILGLATILGWWAVEPAWDLGPVLRDPISLVRSNGYLALPLLIGLGVWIQGLRMGFQSDVIGAEAVREGVRNALITLGAGMVLAALIGGEMGQDGITASLVATPVMLVAGAGAVAAAEMSATRRLAARRRATAPGWDRWARVSGGAAVMLLIVTGIGALVLGPGALDLVMGGLEALWTGISTIILWIMYGVIYVIYYVYRFIAWIINSIFGDVHTPVELPEMGQQQAPTQEPLNPPEETGMDPTLVTLLRWIALIIAIIIVGTMVFVMARRRSQEPGGDATEEERSSIFSADLARQQLRNLFRRKPRPERPRRLDLDREPDSVRETMLYLQVLADRQHVPRAPRETPHDFTDRLAAEWPGLSRPLETIRERYERVRYGETEEDRRAAVDAWHQIWSARKEVAS